MSLLGIVTLKTKRNILKTTQIHLIYIPIYYYSIRMYEDYLRFQDEFLCFIIRKKVALRMKPKMPLT